MGKTRWTALFLLAGLGVGLGIVAGRVWWDARTALAAGVQAEAQGDKPEAVRLYLQAARMYLPGGSIGPRALDRLNAVAIAADKEGDPPTARAALEAMRAAILGARSLYTPHAERLPGVEDRLSRLLAQAEASQGADSVAWHAAALARRPGPNIPYVLMALLGLAGWLGAAVLFIKRGLDQGLRLRRGPAIAAGLVLVVGVVLFVTGLRLA